MARSYIFIVLSMVSSSSGLITCPGFPGFCSEAFPGNACQVVCSTGRNNVPLCQDDGTWTDIPRCIEHEPGVEEQIPGLCPGISGYCSLGFLHMSCKFNCPTGPNIDSICTADGTWAPYPTCEGDQRDLRDGCDGCPGPQGGERNRTAERILNLNTVSDRRIPKTIENGGGRKNVPSFAGNINIGPLDSGRKQNTPSQSRPQQNQGRQQQFPQQGFRQNQNPRQQNPSQQQRPRQQQNFRQQQQQNTRQQQNNIQQNTRQQQRPRQNSLFADQSSQQQPQQQQPRQQQPRQKTPRQQQPRQQQPRQPQISQQSTLFDQIKARAQGNNGAPSPPRQQQFQPQAAVERPQQVSQPRPRQQPGFGGPQQTFGVFESVDLSSNFGGPSPPSPVSLRQQPRQQKQQQDDRFFGEFQNVNLQG